ncbi:tRNA(Met) cytidine acetyltransferase TmcA [Halomarina pelagica]|uniref:tRNA(Met) cytidine acetyltransferase TmcA n=1 Tax=Halomarina pelagica TaxID=2961599 RepID=UPI0020C3E439|nr:tRNA(Met) cytidine acetyltransferase TmcA [Halomarina sp. BND7]
MLTSLVRSLRAEARRANERRLLALAGEHDACLDALPGVLDAGAIEDAVLIGHRDVRGLTRHEPRRADELLGTTRECVVVDAHDECRPNALGRAAGAVDGGGLLVLLAPPLDAWPDRRDRFDESLAVPPDALDDVAGNFRRRLVRLLRQHPGIAIADPETGAVERDGLTEPYPARERGTPDPPPRHGFPDAAYRACLTDDQVAAVRAFETLRDPDAAVVLEADRGRGKSSAAGLAAGSLAAVGRDVLVTAPTRGGAVELFARARELLDALGVLASADDGDLAATGGGRVRFERPARAANLPGDPDAVFVDEAAGLSVALLSSFLDGPPVGFATTVHGYEGAGRGFSVRFRERLDASDRDVTDCVMRAPIRYAASDPIEPWLFRALLLDANPPVEPLVEGATPETVAYERPTPGDLLADEHRLRELFGLLVLAHYRTEPNDLARLLDAPNLTARVLAHDGHVVAVALLAREGGLPPAVRERAYRIGRVRGNMLPDLLMGQLRDPAAGAPVGRRVVRIAVHPAVRSRGLGSHLLGRVHAEFGDRLDWFGVSYGATPRLLSFWRANGYRVVHLSTTRNETSGERSAAMLRPAGAEGAGGTNGAADAEDAEDAEDASDAGGAVDAADAADAADALPDRHARWFRERIAGVLSDSLADLDPDVVRAALAATGGRAALDLGDREWHLVAAAAYGPGQFDVHPEPFRRLVVRALTDPDPDPPLDADAERLLVRRVLQARGWRTVAEELGFQTPSGARRAAGRAFRALCERYGGSAVAEERGRYE